MEISQYLRKLARNNYYQTIYSLGKEGRLRIFENDSNFSNIQITFLRYINIYASVLTDISLGDVGEIVLDNDLYTDAYLMYRNQKDKKQIQSSKEDNESKKAVPTSSWVFKNPTKREN